jgi:hypothetical protein
MTTSSLKEAQIAAFKWRVHLLFDHYLIWVKDRNAYVVREGQRGAEELESKVNELILTAMESQQEKSQ